MNRQLIHYQDNQMANENTKSLKLVSDQRIAH